MKPWDLLQKNQERLKALKSSQILGVVEKNVTLNGKIMVGKGTVLKSGCYIEGPVEIGQNSQIGPNCYIRPYTKIGNDVTIGQAVELKNSIISDGSFIKHLSYLADSVIEENVNFGAGTITANLRHDQKTIKMNLNNKIVDSGIKKFGVWIKKYSKTGIHTSIYPGMVIGPYSLTYPGEIVKENIKPYHIGDQKLSEEKIKEIWSGKQEKISNYSN